MKTLVWGALPLVALAALVSIDHIPGTNISLTVPFAAEGPGPTFNTLGEVDGTNVVEISGAEIDETSGNLNMTTVSVRTGMTLSQALARWLFTDDTLVPIEQIFPPGQSVEDVQQSNQLAFSSSEASAVIAAMNFLEKPVAIEVAEVVEDSAAVGHLLPGDMLISVDRIAVSTPEEVQQIVRTKAPGDQVSVGVDRDGDQVEETISLGAHPQDEAVPLLGISMASVATDGTEVTFNLDDIGGPSAGLMFSLAVVDKLSPGPLNGGKFVAGTGTIAEDGSVGSIGGIAHKVRAAQDAGAEVFLSPADNCAEAAGAGDSDITILKVDSLSNAIDQMAAYSAGDAVELCS